MPAQTDLIDIPNRFADILLNQASPTSNRLQTGTRGNG